MYGIYLTGNRMMLGVTNYSTFRVKLQEDLHVMFLMLWNVQTCRLDEYF
jgi:hypothetical protein